MSSSHKHIYQLTVTWTGNQGLGTSNYTVYNRNHIIQAGEKTTIPGSSDPAFRGDKNRYNPEELLVASLSSCHMLWYLHLCSQAGVIITAYEDIATGTMEETADGGGYFTEVTLHPVITVTDEAMVPLADSVHRKANELCFIANSCKFPVHHSAQYQTAVME